MSLIPVTLRRSKSTHILHTQKTDNTQYIFKQVPPSVAIPQCIKFRNSKKLNVNRSYLAQAENIFYICYKLNENLDVLDMIGYAAYRLESGSVNILDFTFIKNQYRDITVNCLKKFKNMFHGMSVRWSLYHAADLDRRIQW